MQKGIWMSEEALQIAEKRWEAKDKGEKERSECRALKNSNTHTSKEMLKILQDRLQQFLNWELPDVPAGFRKGRGLLPLKSKSRGRENGVFLEFECKWTQGIFWGWWKYSKSGSWEIDGERVETVSDFFWGGGGAPKSLQMVIAAMKLEDAYSLEGKLWMT